MKIKCPSSNEAWREWYVIALKCPSSNEASEEYSKVGCGFGWVFGMTTIEGSHLLPGGSYK